MIGFFLYICLLEAIEFLSLQHRLKITDQSMDRL